MNTYFAICPRGLEELLSDELRALGAGELRTTHGGVFFVGDWSTCYRANLESRIANSVVHMAQLAKIDVTKLPIYATVKTTEGMGTTPWICPSSAQLKN